MSEDISKKDEFISVAKSLFYSKGYSKTSIQNIIDGADSAKGTFYHYFKSKEDLLNQMSQQDISALYSSLYEMLKLNIPADEKFNRILQSASNWKSDNVNLLKVLVSVIMSDANIHLRHAMTRETIKQVVPIYTQIINQGVEEGIFNVYDSEYTANVLITGFNGTAEKMQEYLLADSYTEEVLDQFRRLIKNFEDTTERILGAKPGTIHIIEDEVLEKFLKGLMEA